jgi:C-terminal processing protease CtpA/Prc
MRVHRIVFSAIWLLCAMKSSAQTEASSPSQILQGKIAQADLLYSKHDYKAAAAILEALSSDPEITILPAWEAELYNFACYESMSGNTARALDLLQETVAAGQVPSLDAVKTDPDLIPLHSSPKFEELLVRMKLGAALWTNSPAIATPFAATMTEEERVAGLSKFWSEARFNFAFFSRLPRMDWDALYLQYLAKVRASNTTADYYRLLTAFAAELHDGHTDITVPQELYDTFYARPGLRTQLIQGRVIITSISSPEITRLGLRIGDEIIAVDGFPTKQYAEKNVGPYTSSSTAQDRDVRLYDYRLLSGPADRPVVLKVSDASGKTHSVAVPRIPVTRRPPRTDKAEFRLLPNEIAYLRVDEFDDNAGAQALLDNFQVLQQAKGLVIDMRANGGGNSNFGYNILRMIAQQPFKSSAWKTRNYKAAERAWGNTPGWFYGSPEELLPDLDHNFSKPIAVLIGAHTFSAAEDFVAAFHGMHRGILVGQRTAGSSGQPLNFSLPGGGTARVCTKDDTAPDNTSFEGTGFIPDFAAELSVQDIRTGKDSVLESASQLLARQ